MISHWYIHEKLCLKILSIHMIFQTNQQYKIEKISFLLAFLIFTLFVLDWKTYERPWNDRKHVHEVCNTWLMILLLNGPKLITKTTNPEADFVPSYIVKASSTVPCINSPCLLKTRYFEHVLPLSVRSQAQGRI